MLVLQGRTPSCYYGCDGQYVQCRTIFGGLFGFGKKQKKKVEEEAAAFNRARAAAKKPILAQDNLFHPLATSPIPAMRERAERIKRLAPCPVHLRKGQRVSVNFDCPDCGWPTHYSEKEWREDAEHGRYVARLREANEDEHDLRSGREMVEFKMPGEQGFEEAINLSSWDVFFYTRNFPSIETERSRRHVSKLLTFPTSVGAVLHENSPYTTRNRRMTREGMRSFLALRQMLHPQYGTKASLDPMRVFIVGARAESTLPTSVWDQLRYMFPNVPFHLYLIGPEVTLPNVPATSGPQGPSTASTIQKVGQPSSSSPQAAPVSISQRQKTRRSEYGPRAPSRTIVVSEGLTMTYIQCPYEEVHHQLEPFDPYTDVFFAFSPGFGFPSQKAYDRPKSEEDGVDGAAASQSSAATGTASTSSAPSSPPPTKIKKEPTPGGQLDPVAASFESRQETESTERPSQPGELPQASSTLSYQRGGAEAPADAASKEQNTEKMASQHVNAQAEAAAAAVGADTMTPGAVPSSTLPALPPLLQAQSEWAQALTQILSTKVPLVITGFSPADVRRDVEAFESVQGIRGEFEWLVTPGENVFGSLSWIIADFDVRVGVRSNWGIWAVRGKRYDLVGPGGWTATGGNVDRNPFEDEEDLEEEEEELKRIEDRRR